MATWRTYGLPVRCGGDRDCLVDPGTPVQLVCGGRLKRCPAHAIWPPELEGNLDAQAALLADVRRQHDAPAHTPAPAPLSNGRSGGFTALSSFASLPSRPSHDGKAAAAGRDEDHPLEHPAPQARRLAFDAAFDAYDDFDAGAETHVDPDW